VESKGELKKLKYKILGHTWTIKFVAKDDPKIDIEAYDKQCYGLCIGQRREIYIGEYGGDLVKRTLAHELTHAYVNDIMHVEDKRYDGEFIAEFVSNYAEQIVEDAKKILKLKGEK